MGPLGLEPRLCLIKSQVALPIGGRARLLRAYSAWDLRQSEHLQPFMYIVRDPWVAAILASNPSF